MYPSILTVTGPATDRNLVTLEAVKLDLNITSFDEDARIKHFIAYSSAQIENYCGRVFAVETVEEKFRCARTNAGIVLARYPVVDITTVTEDDVELVEDTDYEFDPQSGMLYRLWEDQRASWCSNKLVIEYSTGFSTIPTVLGRACMDLVKLQRSKSNRDPMLKSLTIPEVVTESYWVGGVPGEKNSSGLPSDIAMMIERYVVKSIGP
jgi:hypothetical protein